MAIIPCLLRRRPLYQVSCSIARRAVFIEMSGVNPPSPSFATTRWHGTTRGVGFLRSAMPTARGDVPHSRAIFPYVAVCPYGIMQTARYTAAYGASSPVAADRRGICSRRVPEQYLRMAGGTRPSSPVFENVTRWTQSSDQSTCTHQRPNRQAPLISATVLPPRQTRRVCREPSLPASKGEGRHVLLSPETGFRQSSAHRGLPVSSAPAPAPAGHD